jgi:hypothetical protein
MTSADFPGGDPEGFRESLEVIDSTIFSKQQDAPKQFE